MEQADVPSGHEANDPPPSADTVVEEFTPSLKLSILWTFLSLTLTIAGFILFLIVHSWIGGAVSGTGSLVDAGTEGDTTYVTVQLGSVLILIALCVGVLVLHEAIHGAGFWYFGGRPEYGAAIVQKILPVLYCTAPGYRFTRAQFSVIILGPLVVISSLGIALMPFIDNSMLVVMPLAINFGGAIGDVWMFGMLLRRPRGTLIEDHKEGLRFHFPADKALET
jgi:hypothetical protein